MLWEAGAHAGFGNTSGRGIINGDKNGFFKVPSEDGSPTAIQPERWTELTANNVGAGAELFPLELKAQMDAHCGPAQPLRATRMQRSKPAEAVFAREFEAQIGYAQVPLRQEVRAPPHGVF